MTKEQPFSGTFKLDKETKNAVRYAEEAEGRRPVGRSGALVHFPYLNFLTRSGTPEDRAT